MATLHRLGRAKRVTRRSYVLARSGKRPGRVKYVLQITTTKTGGIFFMAPSTQNTPGRECYARHSFLRYTGASKVLGRLTNAADPAITGQDADVPEPL